MRENYTEKIEYWLIVCRVGKVVLCTLALFLSGYVIQQRTLRDLRAAIRPHEQQQQKNRDKRQGKEEKSKETEEKKQSTTTTWQRQTLARIQAQAALKRWSTEHPDPLLHAAVSRAERRRLIKAEMMRLAQQTEGKYRPRRRRLW
ncbi:hypothetical protein CP532_0578 [Ophiocordyceps camponoti-leonardi (nom. inval.)]|nr:hypothetical protein CP532_0578 [Ophiocordyceps camponoti-leonardi (nom. inval.)]